MYKRLSVLILLLFVVSCASMGATNTTATNVGVTAYEMAGLSLTQAYTIEKSLFRAGKITAKQDSDFQLGPYTKAVSCYKAMGTVAVSVITATDSTAKASFQTKFNELNAQLPGLIADVMAFIETVNK